MLKQMMYDPIPVRSQDISNGREEELIQSEWIVCLPTYV